MLPLKFFATRWAVNVLLSAIIVDMLLIHAALHILAAVGAEDARPCTVLPVLLILIRIQLYTAVVRAGDSYQGSRASVRQQLFVVHQGIIHTAILLHTLYLDLT